MSDEQPESTQSASEPEASAETSTDQEGPSAPAGNEAKGGQAESVPPGWYPDPRNPASGKQRYWDGGAWTEQISSAGQLPAGAPVPVISTERRSADERKVILAQQIQFAAARGRRVESQGDFQAVLVSGQPVNHTLHAILTIFTCLLWGIVWAIIAGTGGEKREMLVIDEFGNIQHTSLGKA